METETTETDKDIGVKEEESDNVSDVKDENKTENGDNRRLFSSEDFKIEVNNLPKFAGHAQLKKLFGHKLKNIRNIEPTKQENQR